MLTFNEKLKLLRINSLLGTASITMLREIAAAAAEQSFEKGDFIFARGDAAADFYVLIDGRVGHPEVQADDEQFSIARQVNASGQMFGFAAGVAGKPARAVSARCEAATKVLAVDGRWFQEFCRGHDQEGEALLRELARAHAGYEQIVLGRQGWVSIRNASKTYRSHGREIIAIDDCCLEIRPGEFCAVVGPAGCGKTTLANLIAGRDSLTGGVIYLDGELINRAGAKPKSGTDRILVPRAGGLSPSATVTENLTGTRKTQRLPEQEARTIRARELLSRFGLGQIENAYAGDLSAGWCFRIGLLRAILDEPKVVLMDGPFIGLDAGDKSQLQRFLRELHEHVRKTFLLMTRDPEDPISVAERVIPVTGAPPLVEADAQPRKVTLRRENIEVIGMETAMRAFRQHLPAINSIRDCLRAGRFFWTIEFIPSVDKILRDELDKLGGVAEAMRGDPLLAGFAVTDRVHSDRDPDPVAAASHLLDHSGKQPLVHFSGKGRDIADLPEALARMEDNGLENMLFISGDRLKNEPRNRRLSYLESVPAIFAAKQALPDLLAGATVNPFKYREEDAMAQYLKLGKKVGAGADFIVTQIGFDMLKHQEAVFWADTRNYRVPLVANVMPMSAARARYIRRHQLAGVTVTDSFLTLLETEERLLPDKGAARVLRRLALQILGVRFYGYAGVQITGIHSVEKLAGLQAQVVALSDLCSDRITWNKAWEESFSLPEGGRANPVPAGEPWYLVNSRPHYARSREAAKYRVMNALHAVAFDKGLVARSLARLLRPVKRHGKVDHVLERLEHAVKAPLFGCETCGMCRLAETQYVCPESCPKGLANGACGGTTENLCEFRDRECIHSVKYRIAKEVGILDQLEKWLIPAVPRNVRHSSSWPPHFRGEGPGVRVIDFSSLKKP